MSVCLNSVCVFTSVSQEAVVQTSSNFACYLQVTAARFSSGGDAIGYLLPVLWMTLCLHAVVRNSRHEKGVYSVINWEAECANT